MTSEKSGQPPADLYDLGNQLKDVARFINLCSQDKDKYHAMPRRYLHDANILFKVIEILKDQLIIETEKTLNYDQVENILKCLGL